MPRTFIIVKAQFPALHAWVDCPYEEVAFLRYSHRHVFHVEVEIEVSHDNRDVEFFMVKNVLSRLLHDLYENKDLGTKSCEMLCSDIKRNLELNYPYSLDIYSVAVFEDNENGAKTFF